jgi:hypothetical protein
VKRRWASERGISQSRHSLRIVPITRSQIALVLGLCGDDFSTVIPSLRIDSSRWINLAQAQINERLALVQLYNALDGG